MDLRRICLLIKNLACSNFLDLNWECYHLYNVLYRMINSEEQKLGIEYWNSTSINKCVDSLHLGYKSPGLLWSKMQDDGQHFYKIWLVAPK
jgi:hypothetical protein